MPATLRRLIDKRISPTLGSTPVGSLTALELDDLYTDLVERGAQAGAGIRQVHAILRAALGQPMEWQVVFVERGKGSHAAPGP